MATYEETKEALEGAIKKWELIYANAGGKSMTQKLREILQSVLLNIKADGLCNLDESCGCGLDDLAPCGNCNLDECEPARWIEPENGNPTVLEEFPEGYYSPLKAV